MRAYEVSYTKDSVTKKQFSDTQKDAKALRRDVMAGQSLQIAEVTISQVEIPTKKGELLAWINSALA